MNSSLLSTCTYVYCATLLVKLQLSGVEIIFQANVLFYLFSQNTQVGNAVQNVSETSGQTGASAEAEQPSGPDIHKFLRNRDISCKKCGETVLLNTTEMQMIVCNTFLHRILSSDEVCFKYTGVPSIQMLKFLFEWIRKPAEETRIWGGKNKLRPGRFPGRGRHSYKISKFESFMLTLVRIRKGYDMDHLAFLFGISQSHVSKVFTTWVSILSQCFKPILKWPSKEVSKRNLPESFKEFPNTRCVIDCTEFQVEKPFRPAAQRLTWSNYKHNNTTKVLVAIMPSGAIVFKSSVYVGSISDKEIVKKSGFLNKLEAGDDVMADRGFNIRDLLLFKKATLNMPSFSHGRQLTRKAVQKSRRIASVRVHVERGIGRIKSFRLLRGVISLKVRFLLNQILTIVCVLCNLQKRLC